MHVYSIQYTPHHTPMLELKAEVRRVNLRILAADKIDDNLGISIVRVE